MAALPEPAIADALLGHLAEMVTPLQIAWPGRPFTPPADPYLAVAMFRDPTEAATIASHDRHAGAMQVSVFWPTSSTTIRQGVVAVSEVAAEIAAHFPRGARIERGGYVVRIISPPSVLSPIQIEDGWEQTPVRIRWSAWARI